jgi:nucleoside-diphosphate-sugar epimerase
MDTVKLFVTGLCGRLGRAVASEASERGWRVVGIDRQPWPDAFALPSGVEFYLGTHEDAALMERLMTGTTHFIHTSGLNGDNLADHGLVDFLRSNVEAAAELIEQCLTKNIRKICISSTMEVLIGRDWRASGAALLDEESPIQTDSAYSLSRALQERLAAEMARHRDVSISLLRYMAFGYCEDEKLGAGLLARRLAARDAARAAINAVLVDGLKGEIFHVGPKTPLTNSDIVRALKSPEEIVEKYFPGATQVLERTGHKLVPEMFWPVTSIEKARCLLGWEPEYTFETWLDAHGWARPSDL